MIFLEQFRVGNSRSNIYQHKDGEQKEIGGYRRCAITGWETPTKTTVKIPEHLRNAA
jgi:hypothetical protein